jgi:type II secretory pathway predicted ATPase ExeA
MDVDRFGMTRRPFPPTPDTALYYPATAHEAALAALERGIREDEGILLLSGAPGSGKTLLGYLLLERRAEGTASAFLTNSHFASRSALLQAILYDLGLPYDDPGEQQLRLRLTDELLKNCAARKRTVVIIDEAHHLSADLLEELRLLANLEAGTGKAVQIVLLAQPKILETLRQPGLESLQQRITVRATLAELDIEEACDYLLHHLRLAGAKPDKVCDETALETIARGAHGVPRCLNQVAHKALALAEEGELQMVDAEAALEALAQLGMAVDSAEEPETAAPSIQKFARTA